MKIIKWFKDMLDAESSVSSKRFCGVLGWLVCIGVLIYCTISVIEAPTITEFFLLSVVGLLGVDSVTNIWKNPGKKKKRNFEENVNENDYECEEQ